MHRQMQKLAAAFMCLQGGVQGVLEGSVGVEEKLQYLGFRLGGAMVEGAMERLHSSAWHQQCPSASFFIVFWLSLSASFLFLHVGCSVTFVWTL